MEHMLRPQPIFQKIDEMQVHLIFVRKTVFPHAEHFAAVAHADHKMPAMRIQERRNRLEAGLLHLLVRLARVKIDPQRGLELDSGRLTTGENVLDGKVVLRCMSGVLPVRLPERFQPVCYAYGPLLEDHDGRN